MAKEPECEWCDDTGWMTCSTRSGEWKAAGPAPDYARNLYDVSCNCEEGAERRREERLWRARVEATSEEFDSDNTHGTV